MSNIYDDFESSLNTIDSASGNGVSFLGLRKFNGKNFVKKNYKPLVFVFYNSKRLISNKIIRILDLQDKVSDFIYDNGAYTVMYVKGNIREHKGTLCMKGKICCTLIHYLPEVDIYGHLSEEIDSIIGTCICICNYIKYNVPHGIAYCLRTGNIDHGPDAFISLEIAEFVKINEYSNTTVKAQYFYLDENIDNYHYQSYSYSEDGQQVDCIENIYNTLDLEELKSSCFIYLSIHDLYDRVAVINYRNFTFNKLKTYLDSLPKSSIQS